MTPLDPREHANRTPCAATHHHCSMHYTHHTAQYALRATRCRTTLQHSYQCCHTVHTVSNKDTGLPATHYLHCVRTLHVCHSVHTTCDKDTGLPVTHYQHYMCVIQYTHNTPQGHRTPRVIQYTLHTTRTQDALQHTTNTACSTHYTPHARRHRTLRNTLPTLHVVHITHYMPRNNPDLKQEKTTHTQNTHKTLLRQHNVLKHTHTHTHTRTYTHTHTH